jgi:uncharacterized repeat protein (TIGR03806 family)
LNFLSAISRLPRRGPRHCFAVLLLAVGTILAACTSGSKDVRLFLDAPFPKKLSDWHLFLRTANGLQPNLRVIPYDLNTPLFSDYAAKYRFVWMPPGASAEYREDTVINFPVGTILVKSFAFPVVGHPDKERLIETRLLVHANSGWVPLPYVWDENQREATLQLVPAPVDISFSQSSGQTLNFTYHIPNTNQCADCHANNRVLQPIGPKARNLNKTLSYANGPANQITYWTKATYLRNAPPLDTLPRTARWNDPADGSLSDRARAYLDNNCAHCHQPGGSAGYTGVDFRWNHFDLAHSGICKRPNSAGNVASLTYDIVPGHPDESILVYRVASTAPKTMMPQLGRSVVHTEGVALLRQWIASLPSESCSTAAPPSPAGAAL